MDRLVTMLQGGRRRHAAAPAFAAAPGRADGQRADPDRRPEPAAGQPPSEAAVRGGSARALQGRHLGVLPRRRSRRCGEARAGSVRESPTTHMRRCSPTMRAGLRMCATHAPRPPPPISRPTRRNGSASARCMCPSRMWRTRSCGCSARTARRRPGCRHRHGPDARAACAAYRRAGSASMSAPRCSRSRATGWSGQGSTNCQVRRGDVYRLPFADGDAKSGFDAVLFHQVLHYLDDPQAALREATRVAKPGGRILIADFAPHELEFLREEHAHRRLGFSDREVQAGSRPRA